MPYLGPRQCYLLLSGQKKPIPGLKGFALGTNYSNLADSTLRSCFDCALTSGGRIVRQSGIAYNDFGARLHEPRTGRWLALMKKSQKHLFFYDKALRPRQTLA